MRNDRLRPLRPRGRFLLVLISACAALAVMASAAQAYEFGTGVQQAGPEQMLFDWSSNRCEDDDIPDQPVRAFRDATGHVQMLWGHFTARRDVGWDLNGRRHSCSVLLQSQSNPDPAMYDDKQWIGAPYTIDGQTIYGLLHQEYQGWTHPGHCDINYAGDFRCFDTSIGMATSRDGGRTYVKTPAPKGVVASSPYPYSQYGGPQGIHQPSNIVYKPDGYYYALAAAYPDGAQQGGVCLMRTRTLADPSAWRAWDGSSFGVRFIDPYVETSEPASDHVCTPVGLTQTMNQSLSFNTYFGRYMLVGTDMPSATNVPGIYYSLSADLIHWDAPKLLMKTPVDWTFSCGQANPIKDVSLLYPGSPSRNFDLTTQDAYIYFTRWNEIYTQSTCYMGLDRDLARIPIRFTGSRGTVNEPICTRVTPSVRQINYADNRWVPVTLTEPNHRYIIEIDKVFQDEPTDGIPGARYGTRPDQVRLRAARDPDGNGRVYRIWYHATYLNGTCWNYYNSLQVSVTRSGKAIYDEDKAYDSLNPSDG